MNPLAELGSLLNLVSNEWQESGARASHEAFPCVPQHKLEAAFVYVESRIRRIVGTGHRARRNMEWLGRWSIAIERELERRERFGCLSEGHLEEVERKSREVGWKARVLESSPFMVTSSPFMHLEEVERKSFTWMSVDSGLL